MTQNSAQNFPEYRCQRRFDAAIGNTPSSPHDDFSSKIARRLPLPTQMTYMSARVRRGRAEGHHRVDVDEMHMNYRRQTLYGFLYRRSACRRRTISIYTAPPDMIHSLTECAPRFRFSLLSFVRRPPSRSSISLGIISSFNIYGHHRFTSASACHFGH